MYKLLVFFSLLLVAVQPKVFDPIPSCIDDDDIIGIDGSICRNCAADIKADRQVEQIFDECLIRAVRIPKTEHSSEVEGVLTKLQPARPEPQPEHH